MTPSLRATSTPIINPYAKKRALEERVRANSSPVQVNQYLESTDTTSARCGKMQSAVQTPHHVSKERTSTPRTSLAGMNIQASPILTPQTLNVLDVETAFGGRGFPTVPPRAAAVSVMASDAAKTTTPPESSAAPQGSDQGHSPQDTCRQSILNQCQESVDTTSLKIAPLHHVKEGTGSDAISLAKQKAYTISTKTPQTLDVSLSVTTSRKATRITIEGAETVSIVHQKSRAADAKNMTTPPQNYTASPQESNNQGQIPQGMDSFERFFTILLRSSADDYVQASKCDIQSDALWRTLCHRAHLPVPIERVRPRYSDANTHFEVRAALVLEEAREAISRGLSSNQQKREAALQLALVSHGRQQQEPPRIIALDVTQQDSKPRNHGITFLTFKSARQENGSQKYFTEEEKQHLMPGQVMECTVLGGQSVLGCVLPCKKERIHRLAEFDFLIFEPMPTAYAWTLTPVAAFIGPCRQFAACTGRPERIPFLQALLGTKQCPSHDANTNSTSPSPFADDKLGTNAATTGEQLFKVPTLNENQEKAVSTFLESPPKSITIVQGPPGTGKTSLLVATICWYLLPQKTSNLPTRRRLVVCAPTNKAVSVLAKRFLAAATDSYGCTVNMILVGDDDKLLDSKKTHPLRPHYVYSWPKKALEELGVIKSFFDPKNEDSPKQSRKHMAKKAIGLRRRVKRGLTSLPASDKLWKTMDDLCSGLEKGKLDGTSLFWLAKEAYRAFAKLPYDAVESDIMGSADVIFCTLCSSASRVMRVARASSIEALIVDEAAAATEPDLYIPFHLGPSRLLVVGDPKQLPSTVLSDRAKELGLDVSLQERLMNHCNYNYTLLNVQYRMHPEISVFPSRQFYDAKVRDGNNVTAPCFGGRATLLDGRPYVFLQVDGMETKGVAESTCNAMEADVVVDLVKRLVNHNDKSWSSTDRLRIITFYTAQVALLQKKLFDNGLQDVLVATVDSSQGCEADVVIVSLVRSNSAGFLKDDRRMNVALTRARHQLVCVGNVSRYPSMEAAYTLHHLAADARTRNAVTDLCIERPAKRTKTQTMLVAGGFQQATVSPVPF